MNVGAAPFIMVNLRSPPMSGRASDLTADPAFRALPVRDIPARSPRRGG